MTTNEVLKGAIKYAEERFKPIGLLTEFTPPGYVKEYRSDLFVVNQAHESIEIEIKVSMTDLTVNEVVKNKNYPAMLAASPVTMGMHNSKRCFVPNYFYFCIAKDIKEEAVPFIKEHWPYAGILISYAGYCVSEQRVTKIHKAKVDQEVLDTMYRSTYYRYKNLLQEKLNSSTGFCSDTEKKLVNLRERYNLLKYKYKSAVDIGKWNREEESRLRRENRELRSQLLTSKGQDSVLK